MKGRSWREVRAEVIEEFPGLASEEAQRERFRIRTESVARVRAHELAVLREEAGEAEGPPHG
ncbi:MULTISPECIES: hypothetical protein [unclassified Streptomyces]|uniref:hypothetical protein n=1 Tax=unclassified Streptomyces TaxID=2593676 RepID=UPI002E18B9AA